MNQQTEQTQPNTPIQPLSIVALDDDADFREYIGDLLSGDGHAVRTVATSKALFETCENDLPEVVLLDMNMGKDSGQAVLEEIRRRWQRLCVIVVTGFPSLESMRTTFKRDGFDYIAKPFGIEEIRAALANAASELGLGGLPQDRLRQSLGRQIRLARTERGWTLKEMSEASGVSVSQLSSIERGAHLPSLESLLSVATALDSMPSQWLSDAGF